MDYKEKYEQAIEVAKETYNKQPMYKDWLEYIFPELKESEDERIKRELIDYINRLTASPNNIDKYNTWIAWLEKQGEPVEINPTEFDTRLQALIGKFDNLPKEELIGSLSFWLNVVQNDGTYKDEEKQGEQKPDWSEEDEEELFNAVYACLNFYGKDSDTTDWLKSLKQRIGG